MSPLRIVVMASGRGSNFQAVVRAIAGGEIRNATVVGLVVDRHGSGAEEFAREENIAVRVVEHASFEVRDEFHAAIHDAVSGFAPDLVLMLGYMRLLPHSFIRAFQGRIINIHPSLLPAFPGINAQRQALEYGVKITGATTHFVDEGTDTGPIILQAAVRVPEGADQDELAALIRAEEHALVIRSVALFVEGRLQIDGRRVRVRE